MAQELRTTVDVNVILAGTALITSITDTHGYYEFVNLVSGYYSLKAEEDGYSFEPSNFVIPTYKCSGGNEF